MLETLDKNEVNVEYAYAFIGTAMKDALVIIRVENPTEAVSILEKAGVPILHGEKLYAL